MKATDAAWPHLSADARAAVQVAPRPTTAELPRALFDAAAEVAPAASRAVRRLPNTNVVSSLVPTAKANSETCLYLGQFPGEDGCRAAALGFAGGAAGLWGYAWHDPTQITGDFGGGCYARMDAHGSRAFVPQPGVMSGVFARSRSWREVTDWEISANVTTQHRCAGAECEYFDPELAKSTMATSIDRLDRVVGNDPASLSLRIYLVDFAMNVLPVAAINHTLPGQGSTVFTAYAGTLLLGQKPGYCDQDYDEDKCSPAVWLLNTMAFDVPGQYAVNTRERTLYYWPALASGDVTRVSVPSTSTLVSVTGAAESPVEHVSFTGLTFTRSNGVAKRRGDAGGIQHDWARLESSNSMLTVTDARNVQVAGCTFRGGGGGGFRADGYAQGIVVTNNTFADLGCEAVGIYGLGLGTTQVTSGNTIEGNDVSRTGLVKFDSPAIVVWNAAYTSVLSNYVHDTSTRVLYVGGSRYCAKPAGFATDGGINMNQWDQLTDANIPAAWLAQCSDKSYSYTFQADCKCTFFRGAHGTVVRGNVFARVAERKDRPFFSDGVVYVSGPGYVADPGRDVTVFEDNVYLATPGEGPPAFRMLYVDGFTGSMNIARNAVVGANAHQGMMLCNWYGHSVVAANAVQLGPASWGSAFEISVNCDGNPVIDAHANLVLSDETSPMHQPDPASVADYGGIFDSVCAASTRADAPCPDFLAGLSAVIAKLGGKPKTCRDERWSESRKSAQPV